MNKSHHIDSIQGTGIVVRGNDIDTDRIIPARYMKEITFEGLEKFVFYDARFHEDGTRKDHPFNDDTYKNASILVVHSNFGCGSSREHAPQSLMRFGIRAILGESFAEIFAGNCISLGVPVLIAPHNTIEEIMKAIESSPQDLISIDITQESISTPDKKWNIQIAPAFKSALISGKWDTTQILLKNMPAIEQCYQSLPYITGY